MTARSTVRMALFAFVAALVLAPLAAGHAELTPEKAPAGSFKRFILSLANEKADASTVKVVVKFPESVPTATFMQAPGWTRTVETKPLEEPTTDASGNEITERIDTVTWEGGEISPNETGEFGFRFQVPDQSGRSIFFPTVQTYSDGTIVRWIGQPGSDTPAPGVLITQAAGGGATSTVETASVPVETTTVATTVTTAPDTTATATFVPTSSEDDDGSNLPLILGLLALIAALVGLGYWLYERKNQKPPPGAGGQTPPDEQQTQRLDPS